MSFFAPCGRLMDLPTLGSVCLLIVKEEEDGVEEWKTQVNFWHPDLAPSSIDFGFDTEEKAVAMMQEVEPELIEGVLREQVGRFIEFPDVPT